MSRTGCTCGFMIGILLGASGLYIHGPAVASEQPDDGLRCEATDTKTAIAGCSALIESAASTDAQRAIAFWNRGAAYHRQGDNDRAIQDLSQAISLKPDFTKAYSARGYAYGLKKDWEHAVQDYSRAVALDPTAVEVIIDRGRAYYFLRQIDLAIQDYDAAIRLDPTNARAFYLRGAAYGASHHPDLSKRDFDRAMALNPNLGAQ